MTNDPTDHRSAPEAPEQSLVVRAPRPHPENQESSGGDAPVIARSWHYSYSGKTGGATGFIAAAVLLSAVMVALIVGAVAITVFLWITLSLVLMGLLVAIVRRVFGGGGRPPTS